MAEALIRGYGKVDFDFNQIDDNFYELYCICICEGEQVVSEEHYTDEEEFTEAITDKHGRELMAERYEDGWAEVDTGFGVYECQALYKFAYVVDNGEE